MKVEIKNIKKGDWFWEKSLQFEAIENARHFVSKSAASPFGELSQWKVKAKCLTQSQPVVDFLITEGMEHYGPQLDTQQ